MTRKSITLSLVLLILIAALGASRASRGLPAPEGTVNDFGGLLAPSEEESLARRLDRYRAIGGNDLIVVTIPAPVGRDYADRLFDFWSRRRPGLERGLILVVGVDGSVALATGPQLRPAFDQATVDRLSAPLKIGPDPSGRPEAVIASRAAAIMTALSRGETPIDYRPRGRAARIIAFLFFAGMLIFPWWGAVSARSQKTPGGALTGMILGVLMILISGPALGAILLAVLAPFGFWLDTAVSGHYRRSRENGAKPAWWAGGNWP